MTFKGMNKNKLRKQRHQVKSRWYYIFWGTATVTVFAGQMYVGSGFRRMAESLDRVLDAPIRMDIGIPHRRHPMMVPEMWDPADPMVIR
jgi:hypothetical protein